VGGAFTFATFVSHEGGASLATAGAEDVLTALREATSAMDEMQAWAGTHDLFIMSTLKGERSSTTRLPTPTAQVACWSASRA
jgi:hypothetical protein